MWFFWLISKNPVVEIGILNEIKLKSDLDSSIYDEVKDGEGEMVVGGGLAGEVVGEGGDNREVAVHGEGFVYVSGFSGGSEGLFGEGDGVFADEESGGGGFRAV